MCPSQAAAAAAYTSSNNSVKGTTDHGSDPASATETAWSDAEFQSVVNLWELSQEEQSRLRELGNRLTDVKHPHNTPKHVVRFFKARSGSKKQQVQAAETMFRKSIQWRLDNHVDTLLQDYKPPQALLEGFPGAMLEGVDHVGDPIFVERLGATDVVRLMKEVGKDEIVRYNIWIREIINEKYIPQWEATAGRPLKQYVVIEDLHGLSLSTHFSRKVITDYGAVPRMDQDNYPEMAKKIILIRAPSIFTMFWSLFKVFFDKSMVAIMSFSNTSNYKKVLQEHMDLSVLPSAMAEEGKGKAAKDFPQNLNGSMSSSKMSS